MDSKSDFLIDWMQLINKLINEISKTLGILWLRIWIWYKLICHLNCCLGQNIDWNIKHQASSTVIDCNLNRCNYPLKDKKLNTFHLLIKNRQQIANFVGKYYANRNGINTFDEKFAIIIGAIDVTFMSGTSIQLNYFCFVDCFSFAWIVSYLIQNVYLYL